MSQKEPQKNDHNKPLPESLRAARATLRGQDDAAPVNPVNNDTGDRKDLFPVSAAVAQQGKETEQQKSEDQKKGEEQAQALMNTNSKALIGREIKDNSGKSMGIFLGVHQIKDKNDSLLGTFNLYAAPEDLHKNYLIIKTRHRPSFNEAVKQVAKLKNYYGYDGFNHEAAGRTTDEAFYDALKDGSYDGEWFIPTDKILKKGLYENKDKGALADTFTTIGGDKSLYASCEEFDAEGPKVFSRYFSAGNFAIDKKSSDTKYCIRLVRAEPVDTARLLQAPGLRLVG